MSINCKVLGEPGRDNVVTTTIETGQTVHRIQFDCGDNCIHHLPPSEVTAVDHLLFSHLHMDHIGGFDLFFRHTYFRDDRPNVVWGPPQTSEILQHRFQGFIWNLNQNLCSSFIVNDINPNIISRTRFELSEAFSKAHAVGEEVHNGTILENDDFLVQAITMNHITPSLAYIVHEKSRTNINSEKMAEMGFRPGAWLKQVKDTGIDGGTEIIIDGQNQSLGYLRENLLVRSEGNSMAYLTDFILDDVAMAKLVPALEGIDMVFCGSQYSHDDLALANKNHHMTAKQSAELAKNAQVGKLILFHISSRYSKSYYKDILAEARAIFPETSFPEHWRLAE